MYLLHYATSLRVVERIARSHIVVSVVISKYVETSVLVLIKCCTVMNLIINSATTLSVARDLTSLLAFHGNESRDDNVATKETEINGVRVKNRWEG
jgi:hypothetical protein